MKDQNVSQHLRKSNTYLVSLTHLEVMHFSSLLHTPLQLQHADTDYLLGKYESNKLQFDNATLSNQTRIKE